MSVNGNGFTLIILIKDLLGGAREIDNFRSILGLAEGLLRSTRRIFRKYITSFCSQFFSQVCITVSQIRVWHRENGETRPANLGTRRDVTRTWEQKISHAYAHARPDNNTAHRIFFGAGCSTCMWSRVAATIRMIGCAYRLTCAFHLVFGFFVLCFFVFFGVFSFCYFDFFSFILFSHRKYNSYVD